VTGLRHWTILQLSGDVESVRERVENAGFPADEHGDGFLVRDPADIAALVTSS
jgi:hypothetical protein